MNKNITNIFGYEILDSRGNPTVCAEVTLADGSTGMASVPSGASTGMFEAVELRDSNDSRYFGKGVKTAVENINNIIAPALINLSTWNQRIVDKTMIELDGTNNKQKLGANAILAVSIAVARAVANSFDIPLYRYIGGINAFKLPVPMMNIINGGVHANNNIDIQEIMIVPTGAKTFHEGLRWCSEIYHTLKTILKNKGYSTAVADEGGFAPNLSSNEEAIELILSAIQKAKYNTNQIKIAIDAASSEWWINDHYVLPKQQKTFRTDELIEYWYNLCNKFPIISIEDALSESDWNGWSTLTQVLGDKIQLVGDDLFVTNTIRLTQGIKQNVANSILIKPNQIGTLTETLQTIETAKNAGYSTIVSHRSGETEDNFIVDIAVATNCGLIKAGAPCRSDRVSKYNRLLRIENEIYATSFKLPLNKKTFVKRTTQVPIKNITNNSLKKGFLIEV